MGRLVSDRAERTAGMVVLPSSLEDRTKAPPGLYRIGLLAICVSIFAFFAALIIAYIWRAQTAQFWDPIRLPRTLWLSTAIILASSVVFEMARRRFGRGERREAERLFFGTGCLGVAFLGSQMTAWRQFVHAGAYLLQNPHSSFFYLFTGLHALHLVGGLIALLVLLLRKSPRRELVDMITYYWHFLGVLWLVLFGVLHLVS